VGRVDAGPGGPSTGVSALPPLTHDLIGLSSNARAFDPSDYICWQCWSLNDLLVETMTVAIDLVAEPQRSTTVW